MFCTSCEKLKDKWNCKKSPVHDKLTMFKIGNGPNAKNISMCDDCLFDLVIAWDEGRIEDVDDSDVHELVKPMAQ